MIDYSKKNSNDANFLKAMYFKKPDWVPCSINILPAAWLKYREALEDLVLRHPKVFPTFKKGSVDYNSENFAPLAKEPSTDRWGTVWGSTARGMSSHVIDVPLANWDAFDEWKKNVPDPLTDGDSGPAPDWDAMAKHLADNKGWGNIAWSGILDHGFFFMRLTYLRGFENLLMDFATDDPRVHELIAIVADRCVTVTRKYIECGTEAAFFAEDLGMQAALPISPEMWRKFVKPSYERIMGQCRDNDIPILMHSDGHILEIIPDLADIGVTMINPQIRANGLDGLVDVAKGRVGISLDLDRQLFPFVTPSEIEAHITEAFEALYLEEGGLMLGAECGPDVPIENIEAICTTMESLCELP